MAKTKSSTAPSGSTDVGGTNIPNVFLKGFGSTIKPKNHGMGTKAHVHKGKKK